MKRLHVLLGAFICIATVNGVVGQQEPPIGVEHEEAFKQMELLAEVLLQVRKNYVDERSYEELIHGAIEGMLEKLDPHSAFLDSEAYDHLLEETTGSYSGIGIQIGVRDNVLMVISPIEDTPAFRAGLQSGDRIIAINGKSTAGISMREAVKQLRGPAGESVRITIIGADAKEEQELEIMRANIEVASIKGARLLDESTVAYVRMTQFDAPSSASLHDALVKLREQGMQALILDLRGNPGGLLQQAILTASLFLDADLPVVSTQGRDETVDQKKYKSLGGAFTDIPLVILVNGGSASASEIVAGAIQDHDRGMLIGEQTYGKASVQTVIRMGSEDEESAIRLTTAHYHTPLDRMIHGQGIIPDISIPLEREEWRRVQINRKHLEAPGVYPEDEVAECANVVDRQLQRAKDLLLALLIYGSKP
jgi:carboxyl-terminal processing protease